MFYTQGRLDRADHLRKDAAALQVLRQQPTTRLILIWQGTALISYVPDNVPSNLPDHAIRTESSASPAEVASNPAGKAASTGHPVMATLSSDHSVADEDPIFLGLRDAVAYFALDTTALDESQRQQLIASASSADGKPIDAEFADLRVVGPNLPADDAAVLAYARGLVYWQRNTRHCSRCGSPLSSKLGGHMRQCTNSECAYNTFPRTDPAVIMLVIHKGRDGSERCLLGRNAAWPGGVFSTLAGFVEPGESLEQAVQREVHEEAAIHTTDVRYIASQPWPFPRSIMLGFEATAINDDIHIDENELADARWFDRETLQTFGNWGDDRYEFQLPRPDSIARFLIDRWMDRS